VVGILRTDGDVPDREYLNETARQLSLEALLAVATDEADVT